MPTSAKMRRCVRKVGRKGHNKSSAIAICTTSLGEGCGGHRKRKRKGKRR